MVLRSAACLVVRSLAAKQKIPSSNADSSINICSGSDSPLNSGLGLISPRLENMIVAPTANQTLKVL